VRLFMITSHVKIIAFQLSLFCKNYRFSKLSLTCEISCSTLEINLVFPCMHPYIILYLYTKCFLNMLLQNIFRICFYKCMLLQIISWAIIFLITSLVSLFLTIVLVCLSALCNTLQCWIVYFFLMCWWPSEDLHPYFVDT
jgi:hypothetical protein